MKIAIAKIKPPVHRPRDKESLSSLVDSIKEIGLIEPIILNERNEIVSGRRRYFACRELKLTEINAEYLKKEAVDLELASIDANLMILPLGSADYDLSLAKRKKIYIEKYPETRQHASKESGVLPFTKDVADVLGVTRRSVELAVARAEKASAKVNELRRQGKLSPTLVNALVRMPTSYQDKMLPFIDGKSSGEVKKCVDMALEKDVDFVIARMNKSGGKYSSIETVEKAMNRLEAALIESFTHRAKVDAATIKPVLTRTNEIISLLEKYIEVNTPVHKPILRKQQQFAS